MPNFSLLSFQRYVNLLSFVLTILMISALELWLVERKFSIFAGGFGSSRVIDTTIEQAGFWLAYLLAQLFAAYLFWQLARRLTLKLPEWTTGMVFMVIMLQLFGALLAVKYQLYSYFSDTVSFTLIKNLGGGSVLDALLFVLDEVAIALVLLLFLVLFDLFGWRKLQHLFAVTVPDLAKQRRSALLLPLLLFTLLISTAFWLPRAASDSRYGVGKTLVYDFTAGLLDELSDIDQDQYGLFGLQYDVAAFDAKQHPYALQPLSVQQVRVAGFDTVLQLEAAAASLAEPVLTGKPSHVVLVVMESTRSDAIGKTVAGKVVAKHLNQLAVTGSLVTPNYSPVGFTTYSLKTLFTGELQPSTSSPSLFADFAANGYKIAVFSGQAESFGDIDATVRMSEYADIFVDAETEKNHRAFGFAAKGSLLVDEQHLLQAFQRTLGQPTDWQQPVFVYFNFQSPHFPYHQPKVPLTLVKSAVAREDINSDHSAEVAQTYWNAVSYADQQLGQLIAQLKQLGVWQDTLLLVTADHGEELFDTGLLGHGHQINTYQNGTFLLANRPGVLPQGPVSLSDFRTMVLQILTAGRAAPITRLPFMYIGSLAKPSQIGLAGLDGSITTLKFEDQQVCFSHIPRCSSYANLSAASRQQADAVLQRWASELNASQQKLKQ